MLGKPSNSFKNSRLISCNWFASWTILPLHFLSFILFLPWVFISSDSFFECVQGRLQIFSSRYKTVFIICTTTNSDLIWTPWYAIMLLFHCLNCPWKTQCFNTNTRSHLNSDNVVSVTLQLEKANPTYSYHGRRRSLPLSRTKVVSVVT